MNRIKVGTQEALIVFTVSFPLKKENKILEGDTTMLRFNKAGGQVQGCPFYYALIWLSCLKYLIINFFLKIISF